jgi:hypothetical protein
MVAMNSIPQHDVANGKGQSELARANPITSSNFAAKKPGPSIHCGLFAISSFVRFIGLLLILISDCRSKIADLIPKP